MVIDNVEGRLASNALASALTQSHYRDRLLGTNQMISLSNDAVKVVTGNNVQLSDELIRRTVAIRLDPNRERPELRSGFAHDNLTQWTDNNRSKLFTAVCTLVQAWVDNGMPGWNGISPGSFEEWARVTGGILANAAITGFLDNIDFLREKFGMERDSFANFVEEWANRYRSTAVSAGELFSIASRPDRRDDYNPNEHLDLLADHLGAGNEHSRRTKLGRVPSGLTDRVYSGYKITRVGVRNGYMNYALVSVDSVGKDDSDESIDGLKTPENPIVDGVSELGGRSDPYTAQVDGSKGISRSSPQIESTAESENPHQRSPGSPGDEERGTFLV